MCTVVISTGQHPQWPLILAANRDEMLGRPWLLPACHWPDQPDVLAGLDVLGGGTWLGINRDGVVAAVLNRAGSLGPAAGKRSRGALPLLALAYPTARTAAHAVSSLDGTQWRGFNLVIADRDGAWFLRGTGQGAIAMKALPPGVHMVTAHDPDDMDSPRVVRNLPRFRAAPMPDPPEWSSWIPLLGDCTEPADSAMNVAPCRGFGTVSAMLVAAGRTMEMCATAGPPDAAPFRTVPWPVHDP